MPQGPYTVIACGGDSSAPTTPPPATGSRFVQIPGLTGGGTLWLPVSGPGGSATTLTTAQTLFRLAPGTYTMTVSPVVGATYTVAGPAQTDATVSTAIPFPPR